MEIFAIPDDDYPGGWFYRFQYYHPDEGEFVRYDNAHDDEQLGEHHRHTRCGEDTAIEFHGIVPHIVRFLEEISDRTDTTGDHP